MEYINENMKNRSGCQLSQWELFLKDLCHDLEIYKDSYIKLEKLMKQKETQHQNYVGLYNFLFCNFLIFFNIYSNY